MQILTSKWAGLSPHLMADIFPVDYTGNPLPNQSTVRGPVTESQVELTAHWQSPFENAGVTSKAPTITALLQSGGFGDYTSLFGKTSDTGLAAQITQYLTTNVNETQGRSGMTKLNSTQVFTGAAPVRIPLTLHFRAFDNPTQEVQAPIDQLSKWTLARQLAPNGWIVSAVKAFRDGQGFVKALLPSTAPQLVGLRFDGCSFGPLVVESMSRSLNGPRSRNGQTIHAQVALVLASLTALDANDWDIARQDKAAKFFNN